MNRLQTYFINLDIYGSKPSFRIGESSSLKTKLGSMLTVLSMMVMLATLGFFSVRLFDTKHPLIIHSVYNYINSPFIQLTNKNFGFAFGLQDPNTYDQFIDEGIYQVKVSQRRGKRIEINGKSIFDWTITPLEIERCTFNKFPEAYKETLTKQPLNDMYCLKDSSFFLNGTFVNEEYSLVFFEFFQCRNTTEKQNCKPQEVIDKTLQGSFYQFAYTDISIDPSDYLNPNKQYLASSYGTLTNKAYKEIHHYFKQIKISTDRGWLITDIIDENYIQNDYVKEMNDFRTFDSFFSYQFTLSTVNESYGRSYTKIQNIMAEVGGVIKVITMFCIILLYSYNKISYYDNITNELVRISENLEHDKINHSTKNNYNSYNNFFKDAISNPNFSSNVKTETNNKRIKPTQLSFNIGAIKSLLFFFTPCFYTKRKDKLFKMIVSLINRRIDIISIIRNGLDVERIQKIIFDADQQKLLNYPQRIIVDKEISHNSALIENDTTEILSRIKNRNSYNNIDKRFVETIEKDIMK
jgi:hypothetical protein